MSNDIHLKMLDQGVEAWNKWREENPDIIPDLSGAFLQGLRLVGANLRNVNLVDATLSNVDFSSVHNDDAHLSIDLWHDEYYDHDEQEPDVLTDMSGAILTKAIIEYSKFSYSNLTEVDFKEAYLSQSDLTDTRLGKSNFEGAKLYSCDLSNAELRSANLRSSFLNNVIMHSTYLVGACLQRAELNEVDLYLANLCRTDLRYATISSSDLSEARLVGADLRECELKANEFIGTDFTQADFTEAKMSNANFSGTNLTEAILSKAVLEQSLFHEADMKRADLRFVKCEEAQFIRADLTGANLSGGVFSAARFDNASLQYTICIETIFTNVDFSSCSIVGMQVKNISDGGSIQQDLNVLVSRGLKVDVDDLEFASVISVITNSKTLIGSMSLSVPNTVFVLSGAYSVSSEYGTSSLDKERLELIDSIRTLLRARGYSPILCISAIPFNKRCQEVVNFLSSMSLFAVVDISDPTCWRSEYIGHLKSNLKGKMMPPLFGNYPGEVSYPIELQCPVFPVMHKWAMPFISTYNTGLNRYSHVHEILLTESTEHLAMVFDDAILYPALNILRS